MKRKLFIIFTLFILFSVPIFAESTTYTVQPGDSMWKIAVKYQIGLSEIIAANPQIENPALIYPNQKITIPNIDDVKALEAEVIKLVNAERTKAGLSPLTTNWELSRVARMKSQDMIDNNYFSHQSPTYGSPFNMMENFGIKYTSAGENIAKGQQTPEDVMNAWMNSSGHRSNILSSSYSQIGVGLATDKNGVKYWTQMFIRPMK
ncbi:SafA/ExsA family spore coat assembly protein [Defluviitalea phaphyphila]|uniref:SafA/ExsA family spore coat assembly protein n=1 Tax=Defluviitalea phaphyphila TaxID=1473580 RepID=UPI00073007D1|nr:SafA/ExsA family spore coat assembly protein [Defluviitalea phaphyphila]